MRGFLIACSLLLAFSMIAGEGRQAAGLIAKAYGLDGFQQIERIDFTCNMEQAGQTLSRTWRWEPKKKRVTLVTEGGPISYRRDQLNRAKNARYRDLDSWFANDHYWLLLPFHLLWNDELAFTLSSGPVPLPHGSGMASRLTVRFPDHDHSPGETYDLYFNDKHHILMVSTGADLDTAQLTHWATPTNIGPIDMALEHRGPEQALVRWYSGVKVIFEGSDVRFWMVR